MNKQIIYAVALDRKALMEKFSTVPSVISDALKFKCNSVMQRRIRCYAVNFLKCPVFNVKH